MPSEFVDYAIYALGTAATIGLIYEAGMTHVANRPYAWKGYLDFKFPFYHKHKPIFIPPKPETKKELRQDSNKDLGGLVTIIDDIKGNPSPGPKSPHQPTPPKPQTKPRTNNAK